MPRLPRNPRFWQAAFIVWFVALWVLSSFKGPGEHAPPIDHIDKIAHFGYFFGGSGLLSAYLYRRNGDPANWRKIIVSTIVVISLIGWLDEWHQSFTPGRSGNDPFDWLADFFGAGAGAFTFKAAHRHLK